MASDFRAAVERAGVPADETEPSDRMHNHGEPYEAVIGYMELANEYRVPLPGHWLGLLRVWDAAGDLDDSGGRYIIEEYLPNIEAIDETTGV
jgi:hypothetical protein